MNDGRAQTVLLMRPRIQALDMMRTIRAAGLPVHNEAMLGILPLSVPDSTWNRAAVLAVTSPSGADMLQTCPSHLKDRPVFAVGPATADRALRIGFQRVKAANGTGPGLVDLIRGDIDPGIGPVFHVSGDMIAHDIAATLGAKGYAAKRVVLYRAALKRSLTQNTLELAQTGQIRSIAMMSKRVASRFSHLLTEHHVEHVKTSSIAVAMSEAIADRLHRQKWKHVVMAKAPCARAMIKALISDQTLLSSLPDR